MTWLITGGAGYIGSHVVASARAAGYDVAIIDDLSSGFTDRIPEGVPFIHADIADRDAVSRAIQELNITGVVHLAARKQVGESVEKPFEYWEWNVGKMTTLLEILNAHGVMNFVFSSSAAVYGNPADGATALNEATPCKPLSPYGATKLAGEILVESLASIDKLNAISLRYFNVAGTANPVLADRLALNLIPIALTLMTNNKPLTVFGTDYPTADGTCIRDYVHVVDLAESHVAAMKYLEAGNTGHIKLNVGTGQGASVLDIVAALKECAGSELEWVDTGRRAGDPVSVVASVEEANKVLGWSSQRTLLDTVRSAYDAWPRS